MVKNILLVTGILVFTTGCVTTNENPNPTGTPIHAAMSISPKLPTVDAKLDITPTATNSRILHLQVRHLLTPGRVSRGALFYVVWEAPVGLGGTPQPQSLGALRLDKALGAQLKTVTPFRSFDLFITAEANAKVTQPTGEHLVWTTVSR